MRFTEKYIPIQSKVEIKTENELCIINGINLIQRNCSSYTYIQIRDNYKMCNQYTYSHSENCPFCLIGL